MDFLELYPVPVSPMARRESTEAMTELLEHESFEAVAKDRVDTIYAWKDHDYPVLRRIHKNVSRAYTRAELEWATDRDLRRFLLEGAGHA